MTSQTFMPGSPLLRSRTWITETASQLYELQKARFENVTIHYLSVRQMARRMAKLEHGEQYVAEIAKTIGNFDINDNATLNAYWQILKGAEDDQDYAKILVYEGMHPDSRPSQLHENLNYDEYFITEPEPDKTKIEQLALRYREAKADGRILSPAQFAVELGRYSLAAAPFFLFNQLKSFGLQTLDSRMVNSQSVPCVLAGIPLRHIKEIEIARSGRILKFRATGSVFLAQQEGGEDAIRIEGLLVRSEIVFIMMLWTIFYFGQGRVKEINNLVDVTNSLTQNPLGYLRGKNVDVTSFNKQTTKPSYEHHMTVPFVTRHIIIPNCYIETLSFEEKLEFGKDIIGYSILLRTYRKAPGFELIHTDDPTISYVAPKGNKNLNAYKIIEFCANLTYRLLNTAGIFINNREWKIADASSGKKDVYYDIDAVDIASTAMLGLVGVAFA